jgi:hypothetical protein
MKRIVTIDFLRGLAIFLMTIFHTWTNLFDLSIIFNLDLGEVHPIVLILGGFFFILGHSRSGFLFLSAIIHQYNISRWLSEGKSPAKMLQKNFVNGILIYLFGMIREGIFNPWTGPIYLRIVSGVWYWNNWQMAYLFETLQIIGLMMIFLGLFNFVVSITHSNKRIIPVIILLFLMAMGFIFSAPYVHSAISKYIGYDITGWGVPMREFTHWSEYFTRLFWAALAGMEEPIFPNMGGVCIAAIIGLFLAQPTRPKYFLLYSHIVATIFMIVGIVYWITIDKMVFDLNFRIHPTWFFLANMGLQIHIIFLFLDANEFNPKKDLQKYAKRTTFFRRWAIIAMTLYFIQFMDVFPRIVLQHITGLPYIHNNQLQMIPATVAMMINWIFFDLIVRYWENLHFILTFEWIMVIIRNLLSGGKTISTDRLNVKESLYEITPIVFYQVPVPTINKER